LFIEFLEAFKNDEISLNMINEEVETIRAKIYEKQYKTVLE
jgi:hypothetical protein